jgi:hypothetical protein
MAARSPSLTVVAPCPIGWEKLAGDDRVRFCGHCQQHVYNVSNLTMKEAVALVERVEGRACMRLQHRSDGTLITRDCFHAVRRARERIVASALGVMVAAAGYWSGVQGLRKLFAWRWSRPAEPRCDLPTARAEPPELPPLDDVLDGVASPSAQQGQGARPAKGVPRSKAPAERRGPRVQIIRMGRIRLDP